MRRRKKKIEAGWELKRIEQGDELEVADILREHMPGYLVKHKITAQQWRVVKAIENCRTHQMGYHLRECEECGYKEWMYNSCQDRHCPKCQWAEQYEWVGKRIAELPRAKYHHSVFTVPDGELYHLMVMNQTVMYTIIYKAAAESLQAFAADPKHLGAQIGMIGVLHTWGQTLNYHVHVHFLVTAGGLSDDGERWINSKYGDKFLFPVRALSQVFRGKFIEKLRKAYKADELVLKGKLEKLASPPAFENYIRGIVRHSFRVHSKPATKKPKRVVKYLGGYMKRVAISNSRLEEMEAGKVVFRYKDNREDGKQKRCRMDGEEFIRRYLCHILPEGFVRVRYYGIFGGSGRKEKLAKARALLGGLEEMEAGAKEVEQDRYEPSCPQCGEGKMVVVEYDRQPVSMAWLLVMTMTVKYVDTS